MLTDGLYEWEDDAGHEFGLDRLGESLQSHSGRPGSELIRCVHEDVLAYAGRVTQVDDLTAMVIKRTS
jgi:serine phosphatase RsbU (regulator of sigma subunit)